MTLQQLRYLVAVANFGTMTAAAEALYVAQSALSRALKALEHELGAELFVREGRTVGLTAEGSRVVRLARTVLDTVTAIEDIGRPVGTVSEPTLTVATTSTLAIGHVARLVAAFAAEHPEAPIEVTRHDGREAVLAAVRAGTAAIGVADTPGPGDLRTYRLAETEVVLVSPSDTRLPEPVPWGALHGLPMVLPGRGSERRSQFEAMFAEMGVRPLARCEHNDRVNWVAGVLNGEGSLLWYRDVAEDVFGDSASIRSLDPPLWRGIMLVCREDSRERSARLFVDLARRGGVGEADADRVVPGVRPATGPAPPPARPGRGCP
ncbi:LysR family transcriptional regulator [Embleya scabrispora]|uniref:LysR family transcriptional regulator n=1 Tax=Embleya scabrispora TaxID=159449 RepID=UPI002AA29DEF|nr:LysR family transcriptional regulator [Embleya scabrispora]